MYYPPYAGSQYSLPPQPYYEPYYEPYAHEATPYYGRARSFTPGPPLPAYDPYPEVYDRRGSASPYVRADPYEYEREHHYPRAPLPGPPRGGRSDYDSRSMGSEWDTATHRPQKSIIKKGVRPDAPPPPNPEAAWHAAQVATSPPPDHFVRGGRSMSAVKARDDIITDTTSVGTTASTVGLSWRSVNGGHGKVKEKKHRTHLAPITGRRFGLLIAEDDGRGCCDTMMITMSNFLREKRYNVETCVHEGNSDQFRCDIESGMKELCSAAQPGDAVFIYCVNLFNIDPHFQPLNVIHTLSHNLRKGVQVVCLFDCCSLPALPPYRMDHRQEKVPDPKNAGLTSFRRLAQRVTNLQSIDMDCDVVCFIGRNHDQMAGGQVATFRHTNGKELPVYTSAFIRAYNDQRNWSLKRPPSFATMSRVLDDQLAHISDASGKHHVSSEILCYKPYDIDQRCCL